MDSDLVYFVLVPAALAVSLFVAAKANSARLALITLVAVAAFLVVGVAVTASASPASHTLVGTFAFVLLPIALATVGGRAAVVTGQAWLALVLSPVGYFVGFVLGMNIWLSLGFPL